MTKFSRISCVALTWDSTGECRGILVRGRGDRFVVQACWQRKADSGTSVAECLREGLEQLGASDSTLVVAGAADAACGMAEVQVPPLKAAELRGALGFELARNCPLPLERVAWGYRAPARNNGSRLAVRIFYLRQVAWEHWLEAVSGLRLDALVPPPVALDPILAERPVVLPLAGGNRFSFQPTPDGGRAVQPVGEDPGPAFAVGEEPLAWDQLGSGPLADLPAEEQASYASALLLGAYGLSPAMAADADGSLPVPYNLRPRRNQLNRFLAVVLVLLTLVLGVAALWREYVARKNCLVALRAETARVEREIERASGNTATDASGKTPTASRDTLAKELKDASTSLDRPSLMEVLVELTDTVGDDTWCSGFSWLDGSVSVELQEDTEDVELVHNLELSPVLGDVLEESKRQVGPKVYRKLKMNARWDLSGDSAVSPHRRSEAKPTPTEKTSAPALKNPRPAMLPSMPPPMVPGKPRTDKAAADVPAIKIPVTHAPGVPPPLRGKKEER